MAECGRRNKSLPSPIGLMPPPTFFQFAIHDPPATDVIIGNRTKRLMLRDKLYYIARILSLIVLMGLIGALVIALIKRSSRLQSPVPLPRTGASLSEKVVAITEGYQFVSQE